MHSRRKNTSFQTWNLAVIFGFFFCICVGHHLDYNLTLDQIYYLPTLFREINVTNLFHDSGNEDALS